MTKIQDYRIETEAGEVVGTKTTINDARCDTCGKGFGDNRPNAIRHAVAKSHRVVWFSNVGYDFTPKEN
jgi:hypothetical protein